MSYAIVDKKLAMKLATLKLAEVLKERSARISNYVDQVVAGREKLRRYLPFLPRLIRFKVECGVRSGEDWGGWLVAYWGEDTELKCKEILRLCRFSATEFVLLDEKHLLALEEV